LRYCANAVVRESVAPTLLRRTLVVSAVSAAPENRSKWSTTPRSGTVASRLCLDHYASTGQTRRSREDRVPFDGGGDRAQPARQPQAVRRRARAAAQERRR